MRIVLNLEPCQCERVGCRGWSANLCFGAHVNLFGRLPVELQHLVLTLLPARGLAAVASCCKPWSQFVPGIARDRLASMLRSQRSIEHCPLPALHRAELLRARVGHWPDDRAWRDEWPRLRLYQGLLLARRNGTLATFYLWLRQVGLESAERMFVGDAFCAPEREARESYGASIQWKVAHGWDPESAMEATVLASRCPHALGKALRALCRSASDLGLTNFGDSGRALSFPVGFAGPGHRSPQDEEGVESCFAASCWTLAAALWRRGRILAPSGAHERSYAALGGEFGLSTTDPEWSVLCALDTAPGLTFTTAGFAFGMEANDNSFPRAAAYTVDGENGTERHIAGFHSPITTGRAGAVQYDLVRSDIVCFVGRPSSEDGLFRALVPTDESIHRLPPDARVTLVQVLESGRWALNGFLVDQRCFVVNVAW